MKMLAPLVFCSGFCALVYQMGWLRELRLVFGASTLATSAVLAIFMGGLGSGGVVLGRRADRHPNALRLYGLLELGVAATALLSPFLFVAVRKLYIATGGATALGQPLALALRLALATLVLGIPTFLMGGTLPAAARGAEPHAGGARRRTALIYGINTLGALCGAMATTFFLLERLGTRGTLLLGGCLNVAVAAAALLAAARSPDKSADIPDPLFAAGEGPLPTAAGVATSPEPAAPAAPPAFVFAAAALLGFAFFLMEIVWYRMLSPLLGGTTYSFGLILSVALAGIGAGATLFSLRPRRVEPTLRLFAATCGLEALGVAVAFGLGDRVAILALALRPEGNAGFAPLVAGWALVCAVVVLPAALLAGYQFPLLISLLGNDRRAVGRHTGMVYVWNTAGSIAGSLVGGFGLLPLLGALGCWRLVVVALGTLAVVAALLPDRGRRLPVARAVAFAATAAGAALICAVGPTAAWRHSAIGAGLTATPPDRVAARAWINDARLFLDWERDGVESTVAINRKQGLSFIVNGKVDGNARADAGTQVMAPLVGAILHPGPKKAMVIGLGTGSSAGWLAAVGSIERVDVAELEPAVLEVARRCAPVNRDVLANPKVKIVFGDARELLMTSQERYDLVFSEPSNPYRAGVAGLYTLEFYRAVAGRLAPGGFFSQWVQAYHIDADAVGRIAATLAAVFGSVELWQSTPGDLLFVCSATPASYQLPELAARVATEPFRSAMLAAWGLEGLEGFLSGFFATDAFARHAAQQWGPDGLNTDDRAPIEFGFARSLGTTTLSLPIFRHNTRERGAHRPATRGAGIDWARVDADHELTLAWQPFAVNKYPETTAGAVSKAHLEGNQAAVLRAWQEKEWLPSGSFERLILAEALAETGDAGVLALLPEIATVWPASAAALESLYRHRTEEPAPALAALERAVAGFRTDPWNPLDLMRRTLALSVELAKAHPEASPRLYALLTEPFSVSLLEWERMTTALTIAANSDCRHGAQALAAFEPDVPWNEGFLRYRADCYAETDHPLAVRARRDLGTLLKDAAKIPVADGPVIRFPGVSSPR